MTTTRESPHSVDDSPLVLDLFCGEGGMSTGFHRAGFRVVGVDLNDDHAERRHRPRPKPLKRYPFPSEEGDALEALRRLLAGEAVGGHTLDEYAAAHASPPCQLFSSMTKVNGKRRDGHEHPDLIGPTRDLLEQTGLPYVIENVEGAPLQGHVVKLCGSMFDPPLDVERHRYFEANWPLEEPTWPCRHLLWAPRFPQRDYRRDGGGRPRDYLMRVVPVYGGTRFAGDRELRRRAMEIDWMTLEGLNQAIPPRYSEFIGRQMFAYVSSAAVAA